MKNKVNRHYSENIYPGKQGLSFSAKEIRVRVVEGKQYKDSFSFGALDEKKVFGLVTSDDHRILLANSHFSGSSCNLYYGIDTKGLRAGDSVSGTIYIGSNRGEYRIPVYAEVIEAPLASGDTELHTLDDFVTLCRKDLRMGFHAYTDPLFQRLLRGKNSTLRTLYAGMSHNPVTYQHMEEFLVAAGRKDPVEFSVDKKDKAVYRLNVSQKDTLYVYLNTWGYTRLEIETRGDFIHVDKKVVTTDDFIGKLYALEYILDRSKLHAGRNFGCIIIRSVHQELRFNIEASSSAKLKEISATATDRITLQLMQDYLKLLIHKKDFRSWYEDSHRLLTELEEKATDKQKIRLCRAFLYYSYEEMEKAREELEYFRDPMHRFADRKEEAVYWFLAEKTELFGEKALSVLPKLQTLQRQEPNSFLLLELLLREDTVYENAPARLMYELEVLYEMGCNSPYLYRKAWRYLNEEEALLRKLSPFYIRILDFARRHEILSEALAKRMAFLSIGLKDFNAMVYRTLVWAYEKWPSDDLLEAICKLIMKGNPNAKEYFCWYEKALQHKLHLTRMYEYYMETVDSSVPRVLPKEVCIYFVYNHSLGERKRAFLYASVIRNKAQDPTSYQNYGSAMEEFALRSLEAEKIDANYAVIYQEFCNHPEQRAAAQKLCRVLFSRKLVCKNRSMRTAIVTHEALREEETYPLTDGIAYPAIYTEDACIVFEDGKHRRFASTVEYELTPLMDIRDIAGACMDLDVMHTGLELYCCSERVRKKEVNGRNINCYLYAEKNPVFTEKYRNFIRGKLLDYFEKHKQEHFLGLYLQQLDVMRFVAADKVKLVHLLIERGSYGDAFRIVAEYGYEGIDIVPLLKLASRTIENMEGEENEELICLAEYVYRAGKYDENILEYLKNHLSASPDELANLWKCARNFEMDTVQLEERILRLSIFTGSVPRESSEILTCFIRNQGREEVIADFLRHLSELYFVYGAALNYRIFQHMENFYVRKWNLHRVCKLALLKYYSARTTFTSVQMGIARQLLKECCDRGLRFAFYKKLPIELIQAYQLEDKVFVEKHLPGSKNVKIRYCLKQKDTAPEEEKWVEEPAKEVFRGIYNKEFLLFYNESLTYSVSYEEKGETIVTEEKTITMTDMEMDGRTKYKLLNRMIAASNLPDRKQKMEVMKRYLWQEAFANTLFNLIDDEKEAERE